MQDKGELDIGDVMGIYRRWEKQLRNLAIGDNIVGELENRIDSAPSESSVSECIRSAANLSAADYDEMGRSEWESARERVIVGEYVNRKRKAEGGSDEEEASVASKAQVAFESYLKEEMQAQDAENEAAKEEA
eukprot:SAG11_NODE_14056_length_627_cov_0.875000_1_plen_132_part_10